jgi:CheY-like chemotaxis protein
MMIPLDMLHKPIVTEPILIIEDDIDDQFLLRKVFERIRVESDLLFFTNGKEAWEYLKRTTRTPFMILCDINMPVMNGLELRGKINEDEELRKKSIPFIFLSTAARERDVALAFDLSVQGFFVKESTLSEMEDSLRTIVSYWDRCQHPNSVQKQFQ